MITKLNLASRPFRNRTLPYILALFLFAISLMGFIYGIFTRRSIDSQANVVSREISELETDLAALNTKGEKVEQELPAADKIRLIGAHKLVANRSFGWSRLFADIEGVLPGNVSASRITVENIFKDGDRIRAELEFAVLSREYNGVAQLIDNMNNSGVFRAELRGQDLQKSDRLKFSEFTLHLIYTPTYAAPGVSNEPLMTRNEEAAN